MNERPIHSIEIPAKSGVSVELKKNQRLRVIDIEGGQVSDLFAFASEDMEEYLSSGRTIDYNKTIYLTTGHVLYSDRSNPMLSIVADLVGKHDFLFTPCSQEMFEIQYEVKEPHPNCLENLAKAFAPYGIRQSQIAVPFNLFMNSEILPNGDIKIHPPISKPGEYIEFRAEMDLIIGVTSCPAVTANNFKFTPIQVEVFS